MTERDLTRVLHQATENLQLQEATKAALRTRIEGGKKPMKKKVAVSLVCALLTVLLLGAAVAEALGFGVMDFIGWHSNNVSILPDAGSLVRHEIAQEGGHVGDCNFRVTEALYDGRASYVALSVTCSDPNALLAHSSEFPDCPMADLGPQFENLMSEKNADQLMTIGEYAEKYSKRIIYVGAYSEEMAAGENGSFSVDMRLLEDGSLSLLVKGFSSIQQDTLRTNLAITAEEEGSRNLQDVQRGQLTFTMEAEKPLWEAIYEAKAEETQSLYPECGVRVDSVDLYGTAMGAYCSIIFTVMDQEAYAKTDEGLWFEVLDEAGSRVPDGALGAGSVIHLSEGRYQQDICIQALEAMPTTITLRGYNCWEKNRYETRVLPLAAK